jgi:demethylmenaquinone methyltransferase/2-methoxy-6-polyprenyl-1,4-benzoquinol methylase
MRKENIMVNYKVKSIIYDLIDVVYFSNKSRSPRVALVNSMPDKPISVLDLCAGTCSNSILIAKNKPLSKITALDQSAEMLRLAERKIKKYGLVNVEILAGDATNIDFNDNTFDFVLLSLVLHEMNETLRNDILREAKRVVKETGNIIVIEWARPKKLVQRLLFRMQGLFEPKVYKDFLKLDLANYFKKFNFNILEMKSCNYTKLIRLTK